MQKNCGHYYYDATYPLYCEDKQFISRQEYRANKWKCLSLVTVNSIKEAMAKGYNTFYEISNELCVSEKTLRTAYNYYKENGMIFTDEEMLENII